MRRPLIAGNWKMNLLHRDALRLAREVRELVGSVPDRDVAVFPSFVSVAAVAEVLEGGPVLVGGQDCAGEEQGALTGEVSADILRSAGASFVILGHSERRHKLGEDDATVRRKVEAALRHGLKPIVCVGETLAERESGATYGVVERQVRAALAGLPRDRLAAVTLAYEPVWAIGTGKVATPEQAQDVHARIRALLKELGSATAAEIRVLYGGSVKGSNIDGLMARPDIDGALVGGASLAGEEFARIVRFRAGAS